MDLPELRQSINDLDRELLLLLARRREVARQVIEAKEEGDLPLRDARREEELLAGLIAEGRNIGLDAHFVTRVFHEIIDDSVRSQQLYLLRGQNHHEAEPRTVAYQGIEGAYSHLAAQKFFSSLGEEISYRGYTTFTEVVEAVEEGVADYALLPVENTTAGSVNDVYDLLIQTKLHIVGEEIFRVRHCLLALDDVPPSQIRRVLSHPQALAQCARYLSQMKNCQVDYYADTAMACRKVREDSDPVQAAIASEEAGRIWGLQVIQNDLADQHQNYTRFIVIARKPIRIDWRIPSKTSIVTATAHRPGALNKLLDVLGKHEINMTHLYSRPKPGSPFDYLFYIDFEGNLEEPRVREAMSGLRAVTSYLKVLGSYPREERGKTRPRVEYLLGDAPPPSPEEESEGPAEPQPAGSAPADPTQPQQLVGRQTKREDTTIRVRDVEIGARELIVIAGPPCLESEDQVRRTARHVKECGARILHAACFRTGTGPSSFEGRGIEGLQILARVGREYDLPVATEVVSPQDVEPAAHLADVLVIGGRNMQNFGLLDAVGKVNRPVILKRGMMASIEEFLGAAEYVLEHGNHQVILCERGIRTFETITRSTLDLGAIPILKRLSHLPVFVDPSHAAGQRELVVPLALAARAMGPHGLLVDVHPSPASARAPETTALGFDDFAGLLRRVYRED